MTPYATCSEAIDAAVAQWGAASVVEALAEPGGDPVESPRAAFALFRTMGRYKRERLAAVYLDAQQQPIGGRLIISVGTLNTTSTHPRDVLKPAILRNAYGFILAHNHPSGSLTVSEDDVRFTRCMREGAALIGIELFDHLIITRHGYASMREQGLGS